MSAQAFRNEMMEEEEVEQTCHKINLLEVFQNCIMIFLNFLNLFFYLII